MECVIYIKYTQKHLDVQISILFPLKQSFLKLSSLICNISLGSENKTKAHERVIQSRHIYFSSDEEVLESKHVKKCQ